MYKSILFNLTTIFCFVILIDATQYDRCRYVTSEVNDAIKSVGVTGCEKPPCKLLRGKYVSIQEVFVPSRNVKSMMTSVKAEFIGIFLPFIGVDGVDAKKNIYTLNGEKPTWPLIAGQQYLYNNTFFIQKSYPQVRPTVHWSLKENDDVITCFILSAKIV